MNFQNFLEESHPKHALCWKRNRYFGIKYSENQNNSNNSYSNNGYNNSNSYNNFHSNSFDNIILIVIITIIKQFNFNPMQMNSIIFYIRKHYSVIINTVL